MAAYEAAGRLKAVPMPALAGYWLLRLQARLKVEYLPLYEKRAELIKKHGAEDKDGNWEVIGAGKIVAFMEEWAPIGNAELEVDVQKIKIEQLGTAQISPAQLAALLLFMED